MARYIDADAEFEHSDTIWFDTPKGKRIEFRKVVKGEWLDEEYDIGECFATCSVCGEISQGNAEDNGWGYNYSFSKYCPNCGARMGEE